MDDLIQEFLAETSENLAELDVELVRFEQNPGDTELLQSIFRLVHTIKGTCGFLGLSRLERVAHAGEDVLGRFRDGQLEVTPNAVTLILRCLDNIRSLLAAIEVSGQEPPGSDEHLIADLHALAAGGDVGVPVPPSVDPDDPQSAAIAVNDASTESGPVFSDDGFPVAAELLAEFEEITAEGNTFSATRRPASTENRDSSGMAVAVEVLDRCATASAAAGSTAVAAGSSLSDDGGTRTDTSAAGNGIRVNVEVLESLMTLVGELVLTRNNLLQKCRGKDASDFAEPLQRLSLITSELQEGVMKTRMQPIGKAWAKLPRIVRDLAVETGKQIDLRMAGAETELDRQVLEMIKDPLVHMVRNSADHGIEYPQDRVRHGKPETGTIRLNAFHEGGHIIIEIADDGRGLDTALIRRKAAERGVASEADLESMTDNQVHQLVFQAGFSTAEKVTSVSGRGVGMDVVRTNIEKIGGTIELKSEYGRGTTFTVKIPLTLAIVSALIVDCAQQRFAIPQINVLELVHVSAGAETKIEAINGAPVLNLRNRLLPLVAIRNLLSLETTEEHKSDSDFVVVIQVGAYCYGIIVDKVYDTEEIVVKPMARMLRRLPYYSGNTILGDGSVIMILDPSGIASATGQSAATSEQKQTALTSSGQRESLVVFRADGGQLKAVAMRFVERIESIDMASVEHLDGRAVVQYRDRLMPLVRIADDHPWPTSGSKPVLVFADRGRSVGVVVEAIEDIVDQQIAIELTGAKAGVIGSTVVNGRATDIVDIGCYVTDAFSDWFAPESGVERHRGEMPRVLLVDGSPFFLKLITPQLMTAGFVVETAPGCEDALERCTAGADVDLIAIGTDFKGMDAIALAQLLQSDSRWRDIPLVALVHGTSKHHHQRLRSAGFADIASKARSDKLVAALKRALERNRKAA